MEKVDFVAQLPRTYIHFDTFQGVILYDLLLHLFFWEFFLESESMNFSLNIVGGTIMIVKIREN